MPNDRTETHPNPSELRGYADRKLEGEALFRVAWHVFQCQECHSRLQELGPWADERHADLFGHLEDPLVPESAYGDVTKRVLDRVGGHLERHSAGSTASAPELFAELVSQPPEAAGSCLRIVRDDFTERNFPFDAALVSLDLARLRLEEGRRSEAERLAREALPVFATRNIRRETRAALRLLNQATA